MTLSSQSAPLPMVLTCIPHPVGVHNPVQQVSSSSSLPSLREDMNQQQHCSSDDDEDDVFNNSMPDSRFLVVSKENEILNNEEAKVLESMNELKDESQTITVKSEERATSTYVCTYVYQLHYTMYK